MSIQNIKLTKSELLGIIKKQTITGSIITYVGVAIGFVTTGILALRIDPKYIGLINVIVSYAVMASIIGGLGLAGVTTRLFPYFRTKDGKHNGFLFLAVVISLSGFILTTIAIIAVKYLFYADRSSDDLVVQFFYYTIPVSFFLIFFGLFDNYYKILFNAIKGIFLKEFVQKLGTFIAIFLMVLGLLSIKEFVFIYMLGFSLPGIILLFYALADKQNNFKPNIDFINPSLKKSIISVGFYSIISGASGIIAFSIDKVMLDSLSGLSDTGIYSIAFYFGMIISIPARSLIKISSALIAESWKNNDLGNISTIYKKSALNLFVVGSILTIGLYINQDNLSVLLKDEYAKGISVILFIAFAFLSDMLGGTAPQILASSKHYKVQTYLMLAFTLLVILTNYIFIPLYGINGAALATLISKLSVNIARYLIVYKLFKLQPYNYKFLLIILFLLLMLGLNYFIPVQSNFIMDIFLRSSIIGLVFFVLIYSFNISEDINNQINQIIAKLKQK